MQPITLIIKNPSTTSGVNDFQVKIESVKKIIDLKEILAKTYPGFPSIGSQKLIFAGKLLQDDSTIAEILKNHEGFSFIFHLVVRSSMPPPQSNPTPQTLPAVGGARPFPNGGFANGGFPNGAFPMHPNPGFFGMQQQFGNQQPIQNPWMMMRPRMVGQDAGRVPLQGNGNQRFAPQPNPENHQQDRSGLYLLIKLCILVYVLSQGGSTIRTCLLAIAAIAIFLVRTGRIDFPFLPHPPNIKNNPVPNAPPANQNQNENVDQNQNENQEDNNNEVNEINQPNNEVLPPVQVPRRSLVDEITGVFYPFLCSLNPTWHPTQRVPPVPQAPEPVLM